MATLDGGNADEREPVVPKNGIWKYQDAVRCYYTSTPCETGVACVIVANFLVQCAQKQIDPVTPELYWAYINNVFNVIFLVELVINMYGSWLLPFWRGPNSAWNIFDTVVVSIGVIDLAPGDLQLPGPLSYIRMFRAFRIFRLFSRVESMKKIITAIVKALPGVRDAFLINLIVMMIYAVLAVESFGQVYCRPGDEEHPTARTPRGHCFGYEYYGNFLRSLYSLFQILTGESWSEMAVRPLIHYYDSVEPDTSQLVFTATFFISFILINALVLINVVVAVLMDGMSGESDDGTETEEAKQLATLNTEVASLKAELAMQNLKMDKVLMEVNKLEDF